jgi:sugar phosphate isomerase/epimerase
MKKPVGAESAEPGMDRRKFLTVTGAGLLSAASLSPSSTANEFTQPAKSERIAPGASTPLRKIPIGVFDPVYEKLSLDAMLDKVSALGLEAMEIGTGGYPGLNHCPVDELLADAAKAKAWKKKFEDRGIQVATLSCHGNPIHPDARHAASDAETFRKTVLLAEKLDVKVIVGFSGCPAGSPSDAQPNWITYRWPPEYNQMLQWQWKEKVIPYWKEAAKFAREHGVHKLAFEMHPNFVVYNPKTLLQLREAVGEEIGANWDFLNFAFETGDLDKASATFRAVGYGHSASLWKAVVKAYMDIGYEGILSIENEDPILPGDVGVERAAYILKNVRNELLGT